MHIYSDFMKTWIVLELYDNYYDNEIALFDAMGTMHTTLCPMMWFYGMEWCMN